MWRNFQIALNAVRRSDAYTADGALSFQLIFNQCRSRTLDFFSDKTKLLVKPDQKSVSDQKSASIF